MRFAPIFLLVGLAIADGASIVKSLTTIKKDTTALKKSVAQWDGGLLTAPGIILKSATLLADINLGTITAKQSSNLSQDEALSVANSVIDLTNVVEATIKTIIAAKPKFDKLGFGIIILGNLELDKASTDSFGKAVTEKVPKGLQTVAASLISQLDEYFDEGINAFK